MMMVIVTLRKEVADQTEADNFYNAIKSKADEQPNVKITGHTANHFAEDVTPS